ncbi:MAG: hypothetical protein NTU73_15105 [Ignavibacteriae bacterium]|nr:hypothetical protein [Ignavibacteriota bacterium]
MKVKLVSLLAFSLMLVFVLGINTSFSQEKRIEKEVTGQMSKGTVKDENIIDNSDINVKEAPLPPNVKIVEGQKGRGNVKDENIINSSSVNDKTKEAPAPPYKSDEKNKGALSSGIAGFVFDNWTGWKIKCYINGYYMGMAGPWSKLELLIPSGLVKIYAIAEFEGGEFMYWGPEVFDAENGGIYSWKMKKGF